MVQLTVSPLDIKDGHIDLEIWLHDLGDKYHLPNLSLLRQAAILAQAAGEERATPTGESCLHQGLTMAQLLAELNLDEETLAAAIVYSSACYADLSLDDIEEHLGQRVSRLVKGTQQMEAVNILRGEHYHSHHPATIDNIRKMLLAMVDDIGVVFIKLAQRLCLLRNVAVFSDSKKKQVAQETLDIYAPLANRLGIGQLKWQLEDLSFRYLKPTDYKKISSSLNSRRIERENYIQQVIQDLTELLTQASLSHFKISGRAKHIYSIFKKMQRKKVDIHEIYDVSAVRVLVDNVEDCYKVLSSVHSRWQPIAKEFDDYIATPKPNGYRSIHTAVIGPDDKCVEIQIRTYQMHEESELGVAAHWMYKEGKRTLSSYEEKIAWLRQVMDWQKEVAKTEEAKADIQTELFDDRVYVFTPQGAVLDLVKGATPLDFAYQLHSELGHRCRGAKVNGHIVPLTYELKNGEQVEILTIKKGKPSRDWLNSQLGYLKTPRAKSKVLQWFKKQDYDLHVVEGREQIEKELRRLAITKNVNFDKIAEQLNLKTANDLFAALGRSDLKIGSVTHYLQAHAEQPPEITPEIKQASRNKPSQAIADIDIHGVGNLLTHIAQCCRPIPGDTIIGYVTLGRGISIHRQDCHNILASKNKHADRMIDVSWGAKTQHHYAVSLIIQANDKPNVLRELVLVLSTDNIPVLSMNQVVNKNENTCSIYLTIEIGSVTPLSKILTRLSQLPDIIAVKREQ